MGGSYSGTAVPHVGGPAPRSYQQPQNWASPAVSGRDLIVHRDVLRQVAADLAQMADELQAALGATGSQAGPAAGAAGGWPAAQQLAAAMTRAHAGVTQFTGQLRQAHSDMARRLSTSADRYDAAEQQITSLIHAATDPSATIIGSGGQDTPVQPGYGQNWTPQQRAAYYRIQHIENMPGNSGPAWTGTYAITEDAGFAQGGSGGYTWQQVRSLLAGTDPAAISAAGAAYGQLSATLTSISSRLAGHGQTLAGNWGGSTAVTAVSQVQQLYQTAADMQANTWAAQQALAWYGPVLETFRGSPPQPATSHPADVQAANQAAQQRMAALNSHIETAYYQMPAVVNKNLPPPLAAAPGGPAGSGGAAPGGGGAGSGRPAGGGGGTGHGPAGAGQVSLPAVPGGSSAGLPGGTPGPAPGATRLAGVTPIARGGPSPVGPSPVGGGPAPSGPAPGAPGPAGPGTVPPPVVTPGPGPSLRDPAPGGFSDEPPPGDLGTGLPRSGFGNPGGLAEDGVTGPGTAEVPPEALAGPGDAGLADGFRAPGFPMTGTGAAGPGQAEAGRNSQYWTSEDEATWGPDAASSGGLLGGGSGDGADGLGWLPGGGSAGRGQQRDRSRLAWLGEDDDFWGAGGPAVPPVIGG
jgi:uncharacterized protein YukE